MQAFRVALVGVVVSMMLAACANTVSRAPVIDRLPGSATASGKPPAKPGKAPDWRPQTYTVQKGDTLYSIALEHGHDYKDVAEWNGIQAPYTIRIGQVIRLSDAQTAGEAEGTTPLKPAPILEAKPLAPGEPIRKTEPKAIKQPYSDQALAQFAKGGNKPAAGAAPPAAPKPEIAKAPAPKPTPTPAKSTPTTEDDDVDWTWPAEGKILANFNDNGNAKGVDIGGTLGQPVIAAAAGKVVHTGSTLRGYGKLIIIKHNKSYFSVYAHNSQVLVREGQSVVKGQRVGEMGSSDADRVKLHFEIRHLGKPVDPLKFLPNDRTS
jgi:lipoprotein NlpD